jgi:hypothetical protein
MRKLQSKPCEVCNKAGFQLLPVRYAVVTDISKASTAARGPKKKPRSAVSSAIPARYAENIISAIKKKSK